MLATSFATGGEAEHRGRSKFQLLKGFQCEVSARRHGWWDTLFRYWGKVGPAVQ